MNNRKSFSLKFIFILSVISVLVLSVPLVAGAATGRTGNNVLVRKGETINDDLYIAGGTAQVNGTVNGDVVATGSNLIINGIIRGDVFAAGGTVVVNGKILESARIAGGTINVDGDITKDLLVTGGNVTVSDNSTIGRDLAITSGSAGMFGSVGRYLAAGVGQMNINGKVGRSATIDADRLTVGSRSDIGGNLKYESENKAKISPGADINGKVVYTKVTPPTTASRFANVLGRGAASFVWLLVLGSILFALIPRFGGRVANVISETPWQSLGFGFLYLIAVPVAAVLLMVTVIGIPVALILLGVYAAAVYATYVYVGYFVGDRLISRIFNRQVNWFWGLFVGLLALTILTAIPYLGYLVGSVTTLFGLGALVLAIGRIRRESKPVVAKMGHHEKMAA